MGMESRDNRPEQLVDRATANDAACAMHGELALRPFRDADMAFLCEVFCATRLQEFLQGGMPAAQAEALLANQFAIQHDYYRRHYPHGRFDIIVCGDSRVGRLYHDWQGDAVQLIDIALLPAYRGAGIGTRLLRAMVAEAARKGMPMRLYVEFNNPVRKLYAALGFVSAGENGVYELMHRQALSFDDEPAVSCVEGLVRPDPSSKFA
jgi:GNAT superfamily N-acetyltransferase